MDSCACIDMMQGHNGIAEFIAGCDEVFIPAATFAEVTEGFYNRGVASTAGIAFGRFLNCENVHFRAADYAVADRYALIARSLRRKGRMIPQNDIWIAATAFETGSCVLSNDRHFDEIDGIVRVAP